MHHNQRDEAARHPAVTAYIGLGANLGDARAAVLKAQAQLALLPCTTLTAASGLYRTAPVDAGGPDYINAVAELRTHLVAPVLLQKLQELELAAGRERPYHNAPRTLDLDLLLYGDGRIDSARLTVPHPRMLERAFVLVPLAEIAGQRVAVAALQSVSGQRIERVGAPD